MAAAVLSLNCSKATKEVSNRACYEVLCDTNPRMKDKYPTNESMCEPLLFYFLLHHGKEYNVNWMSVGLKYAYRQWLINDGWIQEPVVIYADEDDRITYHRSNRNIDSDFDFISARNPNPNRNRNRDRLFNFYKF